MFFIFSVAFNIWCHSWCQNKEIPLKYYIFYRRVMGILFRTLRGLFIQCKRPEGFLRGA